MRISVNSGSGDGLLAGRRYATGTFTPQCLRLHRHTPPGAERRRLGQIPMRSIHHQIRILEDVGHIAANLLKVQSRKEPRFVRFLKIVARGASRMKKLVSQTTKWNRFFFQPLIVSWPVQSQSDFPRSVVSLRPVSHLYLAPEPPTKRSFFWTHPKIGDLQKPGRLITTAARFVGTTGWSVFGQRPNPPLRPPFQVRLPCH